MSEHNKIQLYVGLEEGGCVDVGAINLVGFTLIETSELQDLKEERDALAAQVEALRDASMFAWHNWRESLDVCGAMYELLKVTQATPQQHLAEIRAQAGYRGWMECVRIYCTEEHFTPHPATGMTAIKGAHQYADSILAGKE